MGKWILIPDSFKGTMSSEEICTVMAAALRRHLPEADIVSIPVADGGEGSVDAFLAALGGRREKVPCTGPDGRPINAFYGRLPDGTAVVEMAAAAGLPLMEGHLCAEGATTYGVGELLRAAVHAGAKRVILGLGGSATNDGGCGCAAALGIRFLDRDGVSFVPVGGTLDRLNRIDASGLDPAVRAADITVMCDIDNPLCGPTGASAVFGPQKGAGPEMVARLDRNLGHLADIIRRDLGMEIRDLPGSGAAGGIDSVLHILSHLVQIVVAGNQRVPGVGNADQGLALLQFAVRVAHGLEQGAGKCAVLHAKDRLTTVFHCVSSFKYDISLFLMLLAAGCGLVWRLFYNAVYHSENIIKSMVPFVNRISSAFLKNLTVFRY